MASATVASGPVPTLPSWGLRNAEVSREFSAIPSASARVNRAIRGAGATDRVRSTLIGHMNQPPQARRYLTSQQPNSIQMLMVGIMFQWGIPTL